MRELIWAAWWLVLNSFWCLQTQTWWSNIIWPNLKALSGYAADSNYRYSSSILCRGWYYIHSGYSMILSRNGWEEPTRWAKNHTMCWQRNVRSLSLCTEQELAQTSTYDDSAVSSVTETKRTQSSSNNQICAPVCPLVRNDSIVAVRES